MSPRTPASAHPQGGLRERKKVQTRQAIRAAAYRLFAEQGYDATPVDLIAAAADVSPSTVFRYFPTKEDIVLTDEYDDEMARVLRERPADEPPLAAVRHVMHQVIGIMLSDPRTRAEMVSREELVRDVPAIRARAYESISATGRLLGGIIAERTGRPADDLEVRVFTAAVFGAIHESTMYWIENESADIRGGAPPAGGAAVQERELRGTLLPDGHHGPRGGGEQRGAVQLVGEGVVDRPDNGDLARPVEHRLGHGEPPADEAGRPCGQRPDHAERAFRGGAVRLGTGVGGVRQQCAGRGGPAGGNRVVRRVLRAADQHLGVVGGVVQRAVGCAEVLQHAVQQQPGEVQPDALAGGGGEREEALGDIAVVLQHARVGARGAVPGSPQQPAAGVEVDAHQQVGGVDRGLHQVGPVEVGAGLGERGDGQAVPRGDHLVVPARAGPTRPGGQQPVPHGGDPIGVHHAVALPELEDRRALLEGALRGHPEVGGRELPVKVAEFGGELGGRPCVVGAFDAAAAAVVTVGVQRGGETALGCAEFGDHEVRGLQGDPAGEVGAGGPPQVRVRAGEQGVVVEHLLEVRDHPLPVDAVAGEAAGQLVVDPAAGHRLAGVADHLEGALGARAGVVPQQELQHHRRRELRCAAEAAVRRVVRPGETQQCRGEFALPRGAAGRVSVRPGALGQFPYDPAGHLADLLAALPPRDDDALKHLPEPGHAAARGGREVGAEVERLALRGEEDGHRPAALAGRRLHRLHVHGVHVRALLAVHLDRDEVLVEVRGRRLVLERLVRHHMAPVAAAVPHAQQHGHTALARRPERVLPPRPPVHRVVRVLKQIGRRRVTKSVHPATFSRPRHPPRPPTWRCRNGPLPTRPPRRRTEAERRKPPLPPGVRQSPRNTLIRNVIPTIDDRATSARKAAVTKADDPKTGVRSMSGAVVRRSPATNTAAETAPTAAPAIAADAVQPWARLR
jgi:AcrR family transcriptional regulator